MEPTPLPSRPSSRLETFARLATPTPDRSRSPLPSLVSNRKLTLDEEKHTVEHLYTQSLEHKKKRLEELEKAVYSTKLHTTVTVDPTEIPSIVSRLCDQSVAERNSKLAKLVDERMKAHQRKVKKFSNVDEMQETVSRLYNTRSKEKALADALFTKYNTEVPVVRRSREELQCNDKRYFEGGFAKKA